MDDGEYNMNDEFIQNTRMYIDSEEYEATKEENCVIVSDLYGDTKTPLHKFESRLFQAKVLYAYTMNNHLLLKCVFCNKIFTNMRINQREILTCHKSKDEYENLHVIDDHFNLWEFLNFV